MIRYLIHLFIAVDQLVTAIVGGFPDESLSSYAYRLDRKGKIGGRIFRPLIDFLFSWQDYAMGHCHAAYMEERMRYQLPPDLR
jgi:hypothetical protein